MKAYEFLSFNGTEIAFGNRTMAYMRSGILGPEWTVGGAGECAECDMLLEPGETFVDPATDDAPWYDPNVDASTEFFGLLPIRIDILNSIGRTVSNKVNGGGVVGPLVPRPRLLQFTGIMVASSAAGMAYGDRWLTDVLAGSDCLGGCSTDEACYLPACPTDTVDYDDADLYLRRLLDVGIVDGPNFGTLDQDLPECKIASVDFQIAAGQAYLFSPGLPCIEDEPVSVDSEDPTCCQITTTDWPGDAVPVIKIMAENGPGTNIVISGKPTFDDGYGSFDCPWPDGMDCWSITIPALPQDSYIVIDGARQQVRYYDPALKMERSGIRLITFEGPLTFPEIAPCSNFCVCAYKEDNVLDGDVTITVEKVIREL